MGSKDGGYGWSIVLVSMTGGVFGFFSVGGSIFSV